VRKKKMSDLPEAAFSLKRILVPVDGSENASRALQVGIELARKFDATLFVLTVTPRNVTAQGVASEYLGDSGAVQMYYEEMDRRSERILADSTDLTRKFGLNDVRTEAVPEFDSVTKQILESAEKEKIDLIVIGTRGLSGFRKLLLGSVSSGVVTHAHCNVMVIR
jgi:nucleotide-binding universal stress UspA family protein